MTTYTVSRLAETQLVPVPRYQGLTRIYSPVTQVEEDERGNYCTCVTPEVHMTTRADDCRSMAGGSYEEYVECGHSHTTRKAAEACVLKVAAAEVDRRNAAQPDTSVYPRLADTKDVEVGHVASGLGRVQSITPTPSGQYLVVEFRRVTPRGNLGVPNGSLTLDPTTHQLELTGRIDDRGRWLSPRPASS